MTAKGATPDIVFVGFLFFPGFVIFLVFIGGKGFYGLNVFVGNGRIS